MQKFQNNLSLLSKIEVQDKKNVERARKRRENSNFFQAANYVTEVVRNEIKTFHHVAALSITSREFSLVCSFMSGTQTKINWSVPIFWV